MAKRKRRIVQVAALALLHSAWWGELKWVCLPVLSCHSCALSWFACPIGVFVHYSGYHAFPYIALGTVLLVGVLLGRLLCGWVCPFGFLQDLLYRIPSPTFSLPTWTRWTKYVVLLAMVFALPFVLGEQTRLSFCRFCPASALQVTLPNMIGGGGLRLSAMTAAKLGVLVAVLLLAMCCTRSFCQLLCPIGALLAPLNWVSAWRVAPATDACISCHKCDKACPTSVQPSSRILQGGPPSRSADCVTCHDCQRVCPVRGKKRQGREQDEETRLAGQEAGGL